ncbi:putative immune-type receptor 7 precursor [Clarias magur]|uniref:Putative immune-type receptor 7 n=1 Tax=Clarias magur TaxID=1594786 RepID=A0A8J4XIQ4_CLAMG|nr:putative immune-type receptor 7 precursor [Clarias magur]
MARTSPLNLCLLLGRKRKRGVVLVLVIPFLWQVSQLWGWNPNPAGEREAPFFNTLESNARLSEPCHICVFLGILWQTSIGISVKQGQNVTLICPLKTKENIGVMTWYKQNPGQGVKLLLTHNFTVPPFVRYANGFHTSRYVVLRRNRPRVHYRLRIISAEENDTATYYCGYSDRPDQKKNMP